jgi:hypothetical protein
VLKKTSVSIGLVIAAAAGAPLTSPPAHASVPQGGWHRHGHYRVSHHSYQRSRNHNRNRNRHRSRIFIRIYIYNKNNNHAVALARPERREARPATFADDAPLFRVPSRDDVTRPAVRTVVPVTPVAPAAPVTEPRQESAVPVE